MKEYRGSAAGRDGCVEAAVAAAARALHESVRGKGQFRWKNASPSWRAEMKAFVRPLVMAALEAAQRPDAALEVKDGGNSSVSIARPPGDA